MKQTGVCPKCGGQDIAIMRSTLMSDNDPRVRTAGGPFLSFDDYLPVTRCLCCTCGYLESWVDPEQFVKNGGKRFWEEKEQAAREQDENDAYWREKIRERKEQQAQQKRTEEKQKNRRDDPRT